MPIKIYLIAVERHKFWKHEHRQRREVQELPHIPKSIDFDVSVAITKPIDLIFLKKFKTFCLLADQS